MPFFVSVTISFKPSIISFNNKNFIQIDPPIFTPTACEGTSTLFEVDTDFMDSLYLSQSGQMYLESACAGFNQVYCLSPTFRAEKSSTRPASYGILDVRS